MLWDTRIVKFVRVSDAIAKHAIEAFRKVVRAWASLRKPPLSRRGARPHPRRIFVHPSEWIHVRQAQLDGLAFTRAELQRVVHRRLRPRLRGIHCVFISANQIFVESVLDIRYAVLCLEDLLEIRFILREEQLFGPRGEEPALAILPVLQFRAQRTRRSRRSLYRRPSQIFAPGPSISKP